MTRGKQREPCTEKCPRFLCRPFEDIIAPKCWRVGCVIRTASPRFLALTQWGEEHVTGRDAPVEIIDRQGKPPRVREEAEAIGIPTLAAATRKTRRSILFSRTKRRREMRWTRATGVAASFAAITPVRRDSGFRDDRAARSRVATPHPGGVQRARSEFHTPQTTPANPYCSGNFTHG